MEIFFIFLNTFAIADKIESVKILGNKRISQETIMLFSKTSINSEIANENSEESLSDGVKMVSSKIEKYFEIINLFII